MSAKTQGRKIAIFGASGQVGNPMLKALLAFGIHTLTAVQRLEATSVFPDEVIVRKGNIEDESFLVDVLQAQDALVLMPPLAHLVNLQEPAIRAAAKAGVPYIFPSEFGPDPFAETLTEENTLLVAKKGIRGFIDQLGVSSWISIVVGPWLDVNLSNGLWGIDVKRRTATIWRGADARTSTASVAHTGEITAAVLSLPESDLATYKRKAIYAASFHLTQLEILQVVQRVTNTTDADWSITIREVEDVAIRYEEDIKNGRSMAAYTKFFVTHFLEGHGGSFEKKIDALELEKLYSLGVRRETLEEVIERAI